MCVYCKDSAECVHERDSCAASRGNYCPQCDHASSAVYKRPLSMAPPLGTWPRSVSAEKASKVSAAARGRAGRSPRGGR